VTKEGKNLSFWVFLGTMSAFFINNVPMIIYPAIHSISAMFPEVPLSTMTLVSTMTALMTVPFSIIAGALAGRKVRYRTLTVLSAALIVAGGVAPYFNSGLYFILVSRVVAGIGVGLGMPLGNALLMRLFDKQKAANMQGIGVIIMNLTGIVYLNLSGVVCARGVKYVWLLHLIILLPLILAALFMKEPERLPEKPRTEKKTKNLMPGRAYLIAGAMGLMFLFYYPVQLNMSSIAAENGMSTSTAGLILSMVTFGGLVSGLLFGVFYKLLKKALMPASLLVLAGSMALLSLKSANTGILMITTFLTGASFYVLLPGSMMEFSKIVTDEQNARAAGLDLSLINVGAFLATPYMRILEKITGRANQTLPILIGSIVIAAIAAAWIYMSRLYDRRDQSASSSNRSRSVR